MLHEVLVNFRDIGECQILKAAGRPMLHDTNFTFCPILGSIWLLVRAIMIAQQRFAAFAGLTVVRCEPT